MRSAAKANFHWNLGHPRSSKTDDDPALAIAYRIAEVVMDIAGPLFWGALLLAFMTGALGIDLFY
jgi:hypothetical protein